MEWATDMQVSILMASYPLPILFALVEMAAGIVKILGLRLVAKNHTTPLTMVPSG